MTHDKNTALKVIEAILFANSDLVNEKDLLKNIPKSLNLKKLLDELRNTYKGRGINIYNVKNKWGQNSENAIKNHDKLLCGKYR